MKGRRGHKLRLISHICLSHNNPHQYRRRGKKKEPFTLICLTFQRISGKPQIPEVFGERRWPCRKTQGALWLREGVSATEHTPQQIDQWPLTDLHTRTDGPYTHPPYHPQRMHQKQQSSKLYPKWMRANPRFYDHLHCVHTRSSGAHMCPRAFLTH